MRPLFLLGCGYTLTRAALSQPARARCASTRDVGRGALLRAAGVEVVPDPIGLARAAAEADVVVSIPPEAGLDEALAEVLRGVRPARLVYLSSTGVYGSARGVVDEHTPVDETGRGAGRVRAERLFGALGGVALRIAAIYGPGRGLHERLREGTFRLPGDGSGHVSRVHVDDLVGAIELALSAAPAGSVFNVGDDRPVRQAEVVEWLCGRLGVPMPRSIPLDEAPPTLRGDRQVANARLRALGWTPRYPTFVEGFGALLGDRAT